MGRLRWHVLALGALAVAVWPLLDLDGVFISDEGSYAIQAEVLQHGGWDMGYPFAAADPEITYPAHHASVVAGDQVIPYVDHPLWPATLAVSSDLLGRAVGLRIVGVGSLVVLAAAAWGIAREVGRREAAPWAFWIAASSSILAHAWMLWAHAPSAAVGAVLVLAVLRSRLSPAWLGVAAVAAGLSVLLRAEGLLWAGAVAVGVLLAGRDRPALHRAVGVGGAGAAAYVIERRWISSVVDGSAGSELSPRGGSAGFLERPRGLRIALLDGAFVSDAAKLLGLAVVLSAAVAAVAVWQRRRTSIVALALGAAATLLVARLAVAPDDPAPGLLVVAPALVLAVTWHPYRDHRDAPTLAAICFLGALALTIYPDGGAFQWGGRLLSPIVGPLSALAAAGLAGHLRAFPAQRQRATVGLAVAGLLGASAATSLVSPDAIRRNGEGPLDRVLGLGEPVLVAEGTQIARLDWQGWPERCWIAVPEHGSPEDLEEIVDVLARSGVGTAAFVGLTADQVEDAGAITRRELSGLDAGVMAIPDARLQRRISEPYRCDA